MNRNEPYTTELQLPLNHRTVLVTRAIDQAQDTVTALEKLGANVICMPMIKIIAPDSWQPVDQVIDRLADYNYLIFTSANGVKHFFKRLNELTGRQMSDLTSAQICAIGEATARSLGDFSIQADLIARDAKAEGLLSAIIESAGGEAKIAGRRFALLRAKTARDVLPVELSRLGGEVDDIAVYQTVEATTNREALVEHLTSGKIDVVMFTSPSTIHHFVTLVGQDQLSRYLQNVAIACIGSVTATTAREYQFHNLIQPQVYTAAALVEAIAQAFTK